MKFGGRLYSDTHRLTWSPSELEPVSAFVTFAASTSGVGWPRTTVSRKWLIRYIWVDESPLVRLTLQSKSVVTSNGVSQTFVNSAWSGLIKIIQDGMR